MTQRADDKPPQAPELRGSRFLGATILAAVLGSVYLVWKYYKHHVLFPQLGPDMWIAYAVVVAGVFGWGVATRFGTKRR